MNSSNNQDNSLAQADIHQAASGAVRSNASDHGLTVERARVVTIPAKQSSNSDANVLWVETLVNSSCASCSAKATCGHSILGRWFGRKRQCIPVRCRSGEASLLSVGQWVEVGVPENILLRASLLAYVFPLFGLLLGMVVFGELSVAGGGDLSAIVGAIVGLIGGVSFSRYASRRLLTADRLPRLIRAVRPPQ